MKIPEFKRERFTQTDDGVLVAEASDIGFGALFSAWHALTHIVLRAVDGTVENFNFTKTDRDGEGEVHGWRFRPFHPTSSVREVLIIND